ncbi:aminotransferase class III-fold pyridoxal phosphate-dependent enzyme [Nonomuraea guangzhouensis]|uniref:Aminotransferase class III-fold pyridoxal phosphate-dependent enzyme n=1 Tax=Nonomuraea guangzhouensis TaxID=1291555 RepID=A0ABW4GNM8_9ACTN|nr:aminotransferase class III-fold pyridoxal phosphate-dependent enzyme [Nonomuraea guangzhouensis]
MSHAGPTATSPSHGLDGALHLDHYGGGRLPFVSLGGRGVRLRLAERGAATGEPFEVIDASGGYASACLGAGHPAVLRALTRAVADLGYATDEIESAERTRLLAGTIGSGGLWCDHFPPGDYHAAGRNSGSEGMELALRLVLESRYDHRRLRPDPERGGRDLVLAFQGAWHGWTGALTPLLNRRHFRVGLPQVAADGPYGLAVKHLPFGALEPLLEFFARDGERLLAVVVEPIQGDAGLLVPPAGYLRTLAALAAEHGALLVADEVLTFAKTGRFFAMADEHGPIPTDVTVIGKSLGMGVLSTSMVIARRSLNVRPSGAVATSDLRPLTCAVIHDGLRLIEEEKLLERSAELGAQLTELLGREVLDRFPGTYRGLRGTGLLQGLELTEDAADRLRDLRSHIIRAGCYVEFMAGAGRRSHGLPYVFPTMRVAPPLVTSPADLEELVAAIQRGTARFLWDGR